jgi:hypothetical protein
MTQVSPIRYKKPNRRSPAGWEYGTFRLADPAGARIRGFIRAEVSMAP